MLLRRSSLFSCLLLCLANFILGQQPPSSQPQRQLPLKSAAPQRPAAENPRRPDQSDAFFASDKVVALKIEIAAAELQKLREDNRNYVRCDLIENGEVSYKGVAIKLKGAAGSFREFDDRPALTLNMDRFTKKQSFHDLHKFHLNNSVQDESYLNELLCSQLFLDAGQPVARVTHARVWLNGRDVGLYVLKEGFDRAFLQRHFAGATGNLYDGGFLQDVDVDLEKDTGDGLDDRSDLKALRDACAESDVAIRWKRMAAVLDVDKFIDFMALELMACHWDGYTLNKNNYRVYFDPQTKRAHFFAHGMDQMFGDPGATVLDFPGAIVSSAVMHNPAWREKYRTRLKELLPQFVPPTRLLARVDAQQKRLLPVIQAIGEDQANAFKDRVGELKQRLIDRATNLQQQVAQPDPGPLKFNDEGFAELPDWYAASESDDAMHDQPELPGPRQTYSIKCRPGGACVASWRRRVFLEKGRYQFQAQARTRGVIPQEDEKGMGVGLRISGSNRTNKLTGTNNWKPIQYEFEVLEEVRDIELVAELRGTGGEVWFDAASLRLKRLPAGAAGK